MDCEKPMRIGIGRASGEAGGDPIKATEEPSRTEFYAAPRAFYGENTTSWEFGDLASISEFGEDGDGPSGRKNEKFGATGNKEAPQLFPADLSPPCIFLTPLRQFSPDVFYFWDVCSYMPNILNLSCKSA